MNVSNEMIFFILATWVDGGFINGSAEETYKNGLVWYLFSPYFPLFLLTCDLLLYLIALLILLWDKKLFAFTGGSNLSGGRFKIVSYSPNICLEAWFVRPAVDVAVSGSYLGWVNNISTT